MLRCLDASQDGARFVRHGRSFAQLWLVPSIERRLLGDRHNGPPNCCALVLKFHCAKNVRSHRLCWISDLDRDIKEGCEALSHEQFAQLAAHKNRDWHHLLSPASGGGRICGFGVLARVGYRRRMRSRARNTVATSERRSARFRRSGRCFWLRHKELRVGYLDRPSILVRDNHARAPLCEMPESNGKVICHADAAM